jgi:transcriptional regulator with XRE-family HTH domain
VTNVLTELRMAAGFHTRAELASMIGIDPSSVERWERGECLVPARRAEQLAQVLARPIPDELITQEPVMEIKRILYTAKPQCVHCGRAIGAPIRAIRDEDDPPPTLHLLPNVRCETCGGSPIVDEIEKHLIAEYRNVDLRRPRGRPPRVDPSRDVPLADALA